jgi:hypothetical protein
VGNEVATGPDAIGDSVEKAATVSPAGTEAKNDRRDSCVMRQIMGIGDTLGNRQRLNFF